MSLTDRFRHANWQRTVKAVIARSRTLELLSEKRLREHALDLRWRAKTGTPLRKLLVNAYALVREASRRVTGKTHYPVQLLGGIAMFHGYIAEMQTGEGKTLTATLPAYLRALPGRGCHVVTVNDYLAERDAELNSAVYKQLGLTVGCVTAEGEDDDRRQSYAADITYGTAKEFGFDFLRDRLKLGSGGDGSDRYVPFRSLGSAEEQPVQRGHEFALIDEADSVLIDEARTPLIIGLMIPQEAAAVELLRWSSRIVNRLLPERDFIFEPDKRSAFLTDAGCRNIILQRKPFGIDGLDTETIYDHIEKAVTAEWAFRKDRDYVISDEEIVIVDEGTGRKMEGRKWQDGLHQAVEAKERLPITAATGQAARVTVQTYFRRYRHLAGMTGTAVQSRKELKRAYRLKVTVIPTHRPCLREGLHDRVFTSQQTKRLAVMAEIERLVTQNRAILVGTPSVRASEALAALLKQKDIEHEVLNAHHHEEEARIIARAGKAGRVTIATNMAGRGTDILLADEVRDVGGLHVIATELHSSIRIDRQLVGRAARQGDPGAFQFFLSLEDELLDCLPEERRVKLRRAAQPDANGELPASWLKLFRNTQKRLEREHGKQRKQLLKIERERHRKHRQMGLDSYLELTES